MVWLVVWSGWNLIVLLMYGWDKRLARLKRYRTRESTLFMAALLGGSVGAWAGMRLFRHKTKHRMFSVGVPLLVFLHACLAAAAWSLWLS